MKHEEIVTPRLRLAALRPEDREALIGLMTDGEVGKTYMVPDLDTEEKKTALFERIRTLSASDERFVYGIYRDNRLIGLINDVGMEGGEIELGYVVSPAEQNRGYATEALAAAVNALFSEGFASVVAGAFAENAASRRVMEKCGMKPTGRTETIDYRGKSHLCVYCAIDRPEE